MGKATTPTKFKADFCKRVAALRVAAGIEQKAMAAEMGVLLNTYNRYEHRSLMPHFLIPRFCRIVGVNEAFLFTGDPSLRHYDKAG